MPHKNRSSTPRFEDIANKLEECQTKLRGYRAALVAGADPGVVARWIAEVQAEPASLERRRRPRAMAEALVGIRAALADAHPDGKAEVYKKLGLGLV